MIVREFLTKLGFEADERKVQSFEKSIKSMTIALTAAVAAAHAMGAVALKLAMDTAKYGDEVAKSARQIGMTSEALQEFRFAFDRLGVSQTETTTALERFSRSVGRAAAGSKTEMEAFNSLGVSIHDAGGNIRDLEDLMPEMADGLAGIKSEAARAAIAQDILGRAGGKLAMALAEGGAEVESLREEFRLLGGGLTNEQAAAAEVFTDAITNMRTILSSLKLQIGAELMPVFLPLIEAFTEFLVVNRELILERIHRAFEVLISVLRTLYRIVGRVWGVIDSVAQAMGGWESTAESLTNILMILAGLALARWLTGVALAMGTLMKSLTLAGIGRWLLLRGAFVALILVLEDLYSWWTGAESVLGNFIGWLQALGISEDIATAIGLFTAALAGLLALGAMGLFSFGAALGFLSKGITGLAGALTLLGGGAVRKGLAALETIAALAASTAGLVGLAAGLSVIPTATGDGTLDEKTARDYDNMTPEQVQESMEAESQAVTEQSKRNAKDRQEKYNLPGAVLDEQQKIRSEIIDGRTAPDAPDAPDAPHVEVMPQQPDAPDAPHVEVMPQQPDAPDAPYVEVLPEQPRIDRPIMLDTKPIEDGLNDIRDYLKNSSLGDTSTVGPEMPAQEIDNTKVTTLSMEVTQNITVPPGSTSEQIAFIERSVKRTMEREVNRAATALEA